MDSYKNIACIRALSGFPKARTYRGRRSLLKDAKKAPFTCARVFPNAHVKGLSPPLFQTGYACP